MAAAVLSSQNSLTNPHHLYFYGSRHPPTGKRPIRSPPPQNKPIRSSPNKRPNKSGSNRSSPTRKQQPKPAALLPGQVIILKRGEDLKHASPVRSNSDGLDLSSVSKIETVSKPLLTRSDLNIGFAGPAFVTSPPASDVPIPTFCKNSRKIMADGLKNLLKL